VSIHTAAQYVLATVAASHFAELAAMGFFDPAADADVGKKLDDVLRGLRAVEGLEAERLAGCVSRGFASVDFTRLVEEAVKVKLKAEAEAKRLIRAKLVGEAARGAVGQGDFDRFAANAAAAVETALGLVYEAMKKGWDAVARSDVTGRKNYVHVDKEFAEVFRVRERDVVQFLRYDVGDVAYGDVRAEGVVVLVFLGGEKSIRVEVLAKSVAGLPIRFEEMEWGGERWTRLATARVIKPSGAEHDVLEAVRGAVAKALEKLGRPADVREPKEERDDKGDVEAYYLYLYGPHLKPFLEHAAERVEAKPAEVRLEGRRIVISTGDVRAEVEFKLLKGSEAESLLAQDVERTLALYKSLKELGVRVEITPRGVKVGREALWALVTTAVEKAIERRALSGLPAEVTPGVELLNVYSAGGLKIYIFRAEGAHYHFAVKTGQGWRIAGGKQSDRRVIIHGEAARAVADAINVLYRERGVERGIKVKYHNNGVPYILRRLGAVGFNTARVVDCGKSQTGGLSLKVAV